MSDADAYRAYIAAAIALAATIDVTDRIATDPTYGADRGPVADRRREQMRRDDLDRYRTTQSAFLAEVSAK